MTDKPVSDSRVAVGTAILTSRRHDRRRSAACSRCRIAAAYGDGAVRRRWEALQRVAHGLDNRTTASAGRAILAAAAARADSVTSCAPRYLDER